MAYVALEELKVCRVCLALDVKMYNMNDFKLSEMFQNITGITAINKKGSILQRVCWECAARLTAAAAFREKALLSDALLKDQVHIKESDIALLKQNYSSLKSPLSVVTSYYIECEHTNDKTTLKKRKTKARINEKDIEFEEYEPWIDVPVKTEVESDPIAVNNMRFHDRKSNTFFEQSNDASLKEDSEDEMTNTEEQINNNDTILENTESKVPYINDDNINFEEDNETVDKIPKLDGFGNIVYEDSIEEDRHSQEASFNKYKQINYDNINFEEDNETVDKIPKLDGVSNSVYDDSIEEDRHSEETSFNKYKQINDDNTNFEADNKTVDNIPKLDGVSNSVYEDSIEEDRHSEEASFNKNKQINDDNINFKADNKTVDKIPKLDGVSNSVYEDSIEEDRHSEETSFNKYKQINDDNTNFEADNKTVDKIPKLDGVSNSVYEDSIEKDRHSEEASFNKNKQINDDNINFEEDNETVDKNPKLDGLSNSVYEDSSEEDIHSEEASFNSSEEDIHSEEASFNKYKQNSSSKEKKKRATISKHTSLHDDIKEQIIALKQDGTNNSRIAFLLGTTRFTVRRWWDRWCKEGHVNKHKRTKKKRKTTVLEDQLLIERVVQEQAVHTPSLAKELGISTQCVRNRLREAGFKPQERKASVPLRSGRNHKVDEETKQQIISMKNNGVSVTEIANQFRVTRTSVYLWWRRWCKENNTKVKHNTIESDQRKLSKNKKKSGNLKKSGAVNSGYTLRKRS